MDDQKERAETSGSSKDVEDVEVNIIWELRDDTEAKHRALVKRLEQLLDNTD